MTTTIAGFKQLITRASQLQVEHGLGRVVYGLEPTGNYHKPLSNWLLEQDQMLVLVSSKSISDNRQTLDGRWDKNDTKDSANVADLIAQGKCQFFEMPDTRLVELRNLLSLRRRLKKAEHSVRMQIRNGLGMQVFSGTGSSLGQWFNRESGHCALVSGSAQDHGHGV